MSVTPETIAVALGRPAPDLAAPEYDQWLMWIDDALMLIEARLGDTALLDQAKLDYVVREAVARHVRHPDDATQVTTAVDDASVARTYKSSTGRLTILDEWWELLSPTKAKGKAFEIDTMPEDAGVYGVDYWWSSPTDRASF
jgi:hypothetical protein